MINRKISVFSSHLDVYYLFRKLHNTQNRQRRRKMKEERVDILKKSDVEREREKDIQSIVHLYK